jgi:hypothetical protein
MVLVISAASHSRSLHSKADPANNHRRMALAIRKGSYRGP